MQAPPIPADDEARVRALEALELLDSAPEERFDRITRLTCHLLGTSIALLSLIDRDRQWFKSAQGFDLSEISRDASFCGHAIMHDETLVVNDTHHDPRFVDNPLVTGAPGIRFYAGCPIHSPDGYRVGTLCIIDGSPRTLSADQARALHDLAFIAENELRNEQLTLAEQDLRERLACAEKRAMVDALTRVWRRGTIFDLLDREVARSTRSLRPLSVLMIDIDHFKRVNDSHGHPTGDGILREVARRVQSAVRTMDSVGRYGGEEFLAVLPDCGDESARLVAERVRAEVARTPLQHGALSLPITVSIGVGTYRADTKLDPEALVASADRALYAAKHAGRNRVELAGADAIEQR